MNKEKLVIGYLENIGVDENIMQIIIETTDLNSLYDCYYGIDKETIENSFKYYIKNMTDNIKYDDIYTSYEEAENVIDFYIDNDNGKNCKYGIYDLNDNLIDFYQ